MSYIKENLKRFLALLIILGVSINFSSCSKQTSSLKSKTVQLAGKINELASGHTEEIIGSIDSKEMYVFFGAYLEKEDFISAGLPEDLSSGLADISRVNDHYSVARIFDGNLSEYSYFYPQNENIDRFPVIIKGTRYKLKRKITDYGRDFIEIEN